MLDYSCFQFLLLQFIFNVLQIMIVCSMNFIPRLEEYSQSEAQKANAYSAVCHRFVFHKSFPTFIMASNFSCRIPGSVQHYFLFSSVWILRIQNQTILLNSSFFRLNLWKNLILETEYFMQTSRNLRNNDRNPGMVEKSFGQKDLCQFTQNKCSKAKIINEIQPEQRQDKL